MPRHLIRTTVTMVILFCCVTGCSQQKRIDSWAPQPLVLWEDVCTQPIPQINNTYRIIKTEPTRGLFPASMAVTRIGIDSHQANEPGIRVKLVADPRNEFLQWNTALDDQMAVSEVFPVHKDDLGGRRITMDLLFDAAYALDARLGLIYGVNELREDRTEVLGTIYDFETTQPLAVIHAEAVSIPDSNRRARKQLPLWKTDSKALARAQFDRLLNACIQELITQDQPPPRVVPASWPSTHQAQPAIWPPDRPTGRP